MKIKGRKDDAWHKKVDLTAAGKKATDADFPWVALQNHTGYYLKKKGNQSQIQIDEQLLSLIRNHPAREVAIAAYGRYVSIFAIRNFLINELKLGPKNPLSPYEYLRSLIVTHYENFEAVCENEARIARCMLEYFKDGSSLRTLGQQLQEILDILSVSVASCFLLEDDIMKMATEVCQNFAVQLGNMKTSNRWMDAHVATKWLSDPAISNRLYIKSNSEARRLLDAHFPAWVV